jgi:hypothetical protein
MMTKPTMTAREHLARAQFWAAGAEQVGVSTARQRPDAVPHGVREAIFATMHAQIATALVAVDDQSGEEQR